MLLLSKGGSSLGGSSGPTAKAHLPPPFACRGQSGFFQPSSGRYNPICLKYSTFHPRLSNHLTGKGNFLLHILQKEKPSCRKMKWALQHHPWGCREAGNGGQFPQTPAPGAPHRPPAAPNAGQTHTAQPGLLNEAWGALTDGGLTNTSPLLSS